MSTPPDDQSCAQCRFYLDDVSACHRNPPVMYQGIEARGEWPIVSATDWCGEFSKPKGPPPAIPATGV